MTQRLPPPAAYGLPERYSVWRPNQDVAVERSLRTDKPNRAIVAPTGFGKSVVAETIAQFHAGRSIYNVVSKDLQVQIAREMAHRFNVWGKNNYDCHVLNENGLWGTAGRCDRAEHLCDECSLKERGCLYFDAWRQAKRQQHVVTNYAYWLAINRYNEEGLGEFEVLIADECHNLPDQLSKALRIDLLESSVEKFTRGALPPTQPMHRWISWAKNQWTLLAPKLEALQTNARITQKRPAELRELKFLVSALESLKDLSGEWIEERSKGGRGEVLVGFEPIWPGAYINALTRGVPVRVFMSATIVPKTLELSGISMADTEFMEFPSSFPVARRPVVHVRTVQMRHTMSDDQRREQVRRIDQIINQRLDRKGIIPTVSFALAEFIIEHSRHAQLMIWHKGGSSAARSEAIERFRAARAPAVLISPSIGEGYNFPGDECEYVIIPKVPFPDRRSAVVSARGAADPEYLAYCAMMSLIQYAGRGMRSEEDSCEVLVTDDQFVWFYPQCVERGFVPKWFQAAVRTPMNQTIPRPLPKLEWGTGKEGNAA